MLPRYATLLILLVVGAALIAGEAQVPPGVAPGIRDRLAEAPPEGGRMPDQDRPIHFEPWRTSTTTAHVADAMAGAVVTDADLRRADLFSEPLVPFGRATDPAENLRLARALAQAMRKGVLHPAPIERFLEHHPESPWRLSVLVGLGRWYRVAGYQRSAERTLAAAVDLGLPRTELEAQALTQAALADLAALYAWTGNHERLKSLVERVSGRTWSGRSADIWARSILVLDRMDREPHVALTCGPYALAALLAPDPGEFRKGALDGLQKVMSGMDAYGPKAARTDVPPFASTVDDVRELAAACGKDLVAIRLAENAPIPVPSIIHWSLNHYSALLEERDGRYRFGDLSGDQAQAGLGDVWIDEAAVRDSMSGVFLVQPTAKGHDKGDKQQRFHIELDDEARKVVWGRGPTTAGAVPAEAPCDESTGCGSTPQPSHMMPVWDIMLLKTAARIRDTPWWQPMPRGAALEMELTYVDGDTGVPAVASGSSLGGLWTSSWFSRIEFPTPYQATYYPQGGGEYKFPLGLVGSIYEGRHINVGGTVRYAPGVGAIIHGDDGSRLEFLALSSSASTTCRLSRIVAPSGEALRLTYDALGRLDVIDDDRVDGWKGQFLHQHPTDNRLITGVRSLFVQGGQAAVIAGRSATIAYDAQGRLSSITDMGGLTSSVTYTSTSPVRVATLVTPYGTTTFTRSPVGVTTRWIEVTDANGDTERAEYRGEGVSASLFTGGASTGSDHPDTVPQGLDISPFNGFMIYRNVFHWDKKAFRMTTWANRSAASGIAELSTATIYHFNHSPDQTFTGRTLESIKRPGENRIWYLYPGQEARGHGAFESGMTSSVPKYTAQRLANGETLVQKTTLTASQQVDTTTDPLGRQVKAHYHPNGIDIAEMREIRDGSNRFLGAMTWDGAHRPTEITGPDGRATRITYGTDPGQPTYGRVLRVDPPQRAGMPVESSTFAYILTGIHAGRLYQTIDPAGPSATYAYDQVGRIASVVDRDGYSLAFQYDHLDRLVQVTYPDGTYEQVVWDKLDPTWTRDRMGRWSRTIFNAIRQPIASMDPEGRVTAFEWCRCGSLQKLIDPLGRVTKWTYDARSRLTAKTWPDGTQTTYTYEPDYNTTTAPNGSTGRLIAVTDAKGQQRRFTYTRDGALASVTYYNPGGTISATTPAVSYQYDPDFGRLVSTSDGIGTTVIEYFPYLTAAQRPVGATEPVAPLTTWPGAVSRVDGPLDGPVDPDEMVVGRFDEWGRTLSATVSGLAETVAFNDTLGRITGYANGLGSFGLSYAGNTGRVTGLTRPFGVTTTLTYLGMSQDFKLASLSHKVGAANVSTHTYGYLALPDGTGSDGTISSWTMSNGAVGVQPAQTVDWSFGYDGIRQLVSATKKVNGSVVESLGYVYDAAGNRTAQQREAGGSFTVSSGSVNSLNQLQGTSAGGTVRVAGSTNEPATVRVNGQPARLASGNRFEAEVPAGSSNTQFTVQATDAKGNVRTTNYQVANAAVPARGYQYDVNGNTISATVAGQPSQDKTFVYDAADRLIAIIYPGTDNRTEFAYNGMGQRVKQTEWTNGVQSVTWFVWRGARIALTATGTDGISLNIIRRFWADGMDYQGTKYLVTRDHLGSVREIISSTGAVRARYDYDVYGQRTKVGSAGDAVDTEVGYTGHWHHGRSGLILAWYRGYDPVSGRWMNREPLGEMENMNLYGYGFNNPVIGRDVDGRWFGLAIDAGFAIWDTAQYSLGNIDGAEYGKRMAITGASAALNLATGVGGMGARAAAMGARSGAASSRVTSAAAGGAANIISHLPKQQLHHIATDKHAMWTKCFEDLFKSVGKTLDDSLNKILLSGHSGRHIPEYHAYVYSKLSNAVAGLCGAEKVAAFERALLALRKELENNPRLPYGDGGLR